MSTSPFASPDAHLELIDAYDILHDNLMVLRGVCSRLREQAAEQTLDAALVGSQCAEIDRAITNMEELETLIHMHGKLLREVRHA